ncbi:MAG TPA: MerR family transcriptional regulator [Thermoleophilaceae bacterium]|nr:MerR family transcriptional regulator [Thermoleophilaceae bacterium]
MTPSRTKLEPAGSELTIDELARRTGMTVRNIRAHQSRGLLPPPEVRARTGYYGHEHVTRLGLIQDMQAQGFNLKAIQRLLDAANDASEPVVDFGRAVLSSFSEEEPEVTTAEDLARRLGGAIEPKAARKAEQLGLLRPLGDGRFELPAPTMIRAGEELVALGIPLTHALAVAETVDRHSKAIAEAFVRLFIQDVMGSDELDRSSEDWERIRESLERLRPLATEAVRAGFQQRMGRVVERQLERMLR